MHHGFMYIIALNALMYTMILRYTPDMTAPKKEHQKSIAEVRNSLAEAIERARYFDETTVLTSRGKQVVVLVGMDFYEQAKAQAALVAQLRTVFDEDTSVANTFRAHYADLYDGVMAGTSD
jgi:prevent-host-death family protein